LTVLAETVSLDGGALLIGLVIALLALAVLAAVVTLGFVLAPRAARGSRAAIAGWVVVLAVEGLLCAGSVAAVIRGNLSMFVFLFPAVVAGQVACFVAARRR
jgi:hypothetical protein